MDRHFLNRGFFIIIFLAFFTAVSTLAVDAATYDNRIMISRTYKYNDTETLPEELSIVHGEIDLANWLESEYNGKKHNFSKIEIEAVPEKYPYFIKYYTDRVSQNTLIATEDTNSGFYNEQIILTDEQLTAHMPDGYEKGIQIIAAESITGPNQVINVVFSKIPLSYTIRYYKDSITDPLDSNFLGEVTDIDSCYGALIQLSESQLNAKRSLAGALEYGQGQQSPAGAVKIDTDGQIINVLYSKTEYNYTVKYYKGTDAIVAEYIEGDYHGTALYNQSVELSEEILNARKPDLYNGGIQLDDITVTVQGQIIRVLYTPSAQNGSSKLTVIQCDDWGNKLNSRTFDNLASGQSVDFFKNTLGAPKRYVFYGSYVFTTNGDDMFSVIPSNSNNSPEIILEPDGENILYLIYSSLPGKAAAETAAEPADNFSYSKTVLGKDDELIYNFKNGYKYNVIISYDENSVIPNTGDKSILPYIVGLLILPALTVISILIYKKRIA